MTRRLSVLLNTGFAGPHAGFFLAEADGHLAAEGLDVAWHGGHGAAKVIEEMQGCDAAYGDLATLIARLGHEAPGRGPQAVFIAFATTPLTIAVAAEGPIHHPRDLAGQRVSGHARDAALVAFPALALRTGLDPASVTILPDPAPLAAQLRAMLDHNAAEGVFGFVNTMKAGLEGAGDAALIERLRFLLYAEHVPELMGNALVVSRALIESDPAAVAGLARAVARGFRTAMAEPERGVLAVAARGPLKLAVETQRWRRTIAEEMTHPDIARFGLGRADPSRIAAACVTLATALALPHLPDAAEVFDPRWLAGA